MKHFTTTMLAFGIMVAAVPAARAADTICPPNPPPGTINGNLTVPAGQICSLAGVTVTGNVQAQTNAKLVIPGPGPTTTIVANLSVGTGAFLNAAQGSFLTIDGNFAANQCSNVSLDGGVVGGNVQIQYCTIAILGADDIGGNVAINDNSTTTVGNNTIGNNLGCQGNTSITDGGVPNTVGGHRSGQCANF